MQDSTAERKRHAPDFGPKQLKLKRGGIRVRTKVGFTALVSTDEKFACWLTSNHHQVKEIFVKTATVPWNLILLNNTTGTGVMSTILIIWATAIWWGDTPSSGTWNCFSTFSIWLYSIVSEGQRLMAGMYTGWRITDGRYCCPEVGS